jgi:hypothetical protein
MTFVKGQKFTKKHRDNISISHIGIQANSNNGMWKETGVSYVGLHAWVRRWKGQALYCENCGREGKKGNGGKWNVQWANIDHKYRRVLDDFIGLCQSCHMAYDVSHSLIPDRKGRKQKRCIASA